MITHKAAADAEPTPELLATYETLADCVGDLAEDHPAPVVAKAVLYLAGRVLWDVLRIEGAQLALRSLADELPDIVGEEGRMLSLDQPLTVTEFSEVGAGR